MIVIEMNPRVSRSSALASKATGFPIAKVAAKLAVGYTLDELRNDITGGADAGSLRAERSTTSSPRSRAWPSRSSRGRCTLTTQMKSVGEVMAIGRPSRSRCRRRCAGSRPARWARNRSIGRDRWATSDRRALRGAARNPGAERIRTRGCFRAGMSIEAESRALRIDPWFLARSRRSSRSEANWPQRGWRPRARELLRGPSAGFSAIARSPPPRTSTRPRCARGARARHSPGLQARRHLCRRVSSSTAVPLLDLRGECEAEPTERRKIIVLGGGPNRIGQGIEFDYCCVHAASRCARRLETIMVNCNPETVSTDYDTSDRLYFEPLTLEDVLEIVDREQPEGVIVQFGGQTPLKLAAPWRRRRADHRHLARLDRPGRGPRALPALILANWTSSSPEMAPDAPTRPAIAGRRSATPGRAPFLRARRPRDGDRLPTRTSLRATSATRSTCRGRARSCSTVPRGAIEVDVDASATASRS
jgi:carbamoyl-phosphate synthase large subunit